VTFRFPAVLFCLSVAGCTSLPTLPPPDPSALAAWQSHGNSLRRLDNWQLQGRFALHSGDTHWTGNIYWARHRDSYRIQLSSPLGQGLIVLTSDFTGASLQTATEQQFHDTDAESLFANTLGWDLPLNSLGYWITGQPAPDEPHRYALTPQGYLEELYQNRWHLQYLGYRSDTQPVLPRKLALEGRKIRLKLVVDNWTLLDNAQPVESIILN